jgi:hypothetical protein
MKQLAKALGIGAATLLTLAAICAAELLNGALIAQAQTGFGFKSFSVGFLNEDGSPARQAGSHPFAVKTAFEVNTKPDPELGEVPDGAVKDLRFAFPPGFIGSRTAVPTCKTADFLTVDENGDTTCPDASAVGIVLLHLIEPGDVTNSPVYNLVPPPGVAAKIGFIAANTVPVTAEIGIDGEAPNELEASVLNAAQVVNFYSAALTIWGIPADHAHDPFRGSCLAPPELSGEPNSDGICDTGAAEVPFLTLPRSCTGPLVTSFEATSWQDPGDAVEGFSEAPGMTGCSKLGFSPAIAAKPTASSAESASGLDFEVSIKDEGIGNPTGLAQSEIEEAAVLLPAGMTVNPSSANGLSTCSEAAYEEEALGSQSCPEASKIGEVEAESPLLAEGEVLHGAVYLAEQERNPFGSLIALYMVIKDPNLGALVKRPLEVQAGEEAGPNAGRLLTFLEDIPQIPVSHFHFHFTEGARGPLLTPPTCGQYTTEAELLPWAHPGKSFFASAAFQITSGVGGGPCPAGGVPPFAPHFEAGSANNSAGAYSQFNMRLTRGDGEQEMTRFDAVLPKGMVAKLAGVSRCPEAAIATAKAKTGRAEQASPSCPANSEIGNTMVGAGVGGILTWVPGKLYLGGPFAGDPLSVIAITPAVAGPFDLGTTVVHEALEVDPETAEVKVDGAHSDPIPHILRGLPVKVKDLRVFTDRPNFTLNPTSCAKKEAKATLFGSFLDVFSPSDDVPVNLAARYQAASCASLKFKPKLALKLRGGTKRGAHPALKATLTYPPGQGYANTRSAVVTLPHSEFLEQGHIRTVCTRVQFSAHQCPEGSVYGKARAFSPLLDEPLEGPVYLRSSSHKLPDIVIALHGLVDFNLIGRIDSVNARIRNSFESAPDAPVSKFVLELPAGKKSLLVNSRDLCAHPAKASSVFTAQNGRVYEEKPAVKAKCGG